MLILHCKDVDICRISKILSKCNIKASITKQGIMLDENITDEALNKLLNNIDAHSIRNFDDQTNIEIVNLENSTKLQSSKENDTALLDESGAGPEEEITKDEDYEVIFNSVRRGEIYLCDFGPVYGSEQGGMRPAVIVQNDIGNNASPTTIVIPCTTAIKDNKLPVHYTFEYSRKTVAKYNEEFLGQKLNTALTEQIRVVDKRRLRKYLGKLKFEVMEELHKTIKISLAVNSSNVNEKEIVYVDRPIYKDKIVYRDHNMSKDSKGERRDVNEVQIQLLSRIDLKQLINIKNSSLNYADKVKSIIELFEFDPNRKGTGFLIKAIIAAPKEDYFNLETLSEIVSKEEINVDKEKVKRSIVAVIKETFNLKKVPAIDFIRLVNSLLNNREEEQND